VVTRICITIQTRFQSIPIFSSRQGCNTVRSSGLHTRCLPPENYVFMAISVA